MTLIESFLDNSPVGDLEKLLDVYIDLKSQDRYECDSIDEASDPRRFLRLHAYSTCEVDGSTNVNNEKQQQLIEIAHQLKNIASDFHLERKALDDRLEGLSPDEISVISEIFTLHQPSVADIADIVLKNLTPATLGFTLDLLIKNTSDRQSQIGLPFDLIGAMYVMKGALNIPSWVKTCCLQCIKKNILSLK